MWEKSEQDEMTCELNLAFFRRGGKGKIPAKGTSLAMPEINQAGQKVLEILRARKNNSPRFKKLVDSCKSKGRNFSPALCKKDENFTIFSEQELLKLNFNFEITFFESKVTS